MQEEKPPATRVLPPVVGVPAPGAAAGSSSCCRWRTGSRSQPTTTTGAAAGGVRCNSAGRRRRRPRGARPLGRRTWALLEGGREGGRRRENEEMAEECVLSSRMAGRGGWSLMRRGGRHPGGERSRRGGGQPGAPGWSKSRVDAGCNTRAGHLIQKKKHALEDL